LYRCYLVHHGRIAKGEELGVSTLPQAIALGHNLLLSDAETADGSGIEIWVQADLLYSDHRHAHDTGDLAPITSPFAMMVGEAMTWRNYHVADALNFMPACRFSGAGSLRELPACDAGNEAASDSIDSRMLCFPD
jgi:hypothetical protein